MEEGGADGVSDDIKKGNMQLWSYATGLNKRGSSMRRESNVDDMARKSLMSQINGIISYQHRIYMIQETSNQHILSSALR